MKRTGLEMNFSVHKVCIFWLVMGLFSSWVLASGFGKNGRGEIVSVSESGRIGLFDGDYSMTTLSRQGKKEAELGYWSFEKGERPIGSVQYMSIDGQEVLAQLTRMGSQWRVRFRTVLNNYSGDASIVLLLPSGVLQAQLVDGGMWFADARGLSFQKWTAVGAGNVTSDTRNVISGFSADRWQVFTASEDTVVLYNIGGADIRMKRSSESWVESSFAVDARLSGAVRDIVILHNTGVLLMNNGVLLQCPMNIAPLSCEIRDTAAYAIALAGQGQRLSLQFNDGRIAGYELRNALLVSQGLVWPGWVGQGSALAGHNVWGMEWGAFVEFNEETFRAVGHQYHPGGLGFKDFMVTPKTFSALFHNSVDLSGVLSAREMAEFRWIYARDTNDVADWVELKKETLTSGMTFFNWYPNTLAKPVIQGNAWIGAFLTEKEDSLRVWKMVRFDSIAPVGLPEFTGALQTEAQWLISSDYPLVVHLDSVHDLPGITDSFKVELELQQEGGVYAYRWDKWSAGSKDSLIITGRSLGNMPLPSGNYQIRWRLVDLVGNSTDWVDFVQIQGDMVRIFEVNPLPAALDVSLAPNVLTGSGDRTVVTVDLLARKNGKFVIHYRLDSALTDLVSADTVTLCAGESLQLKRTLRISGVADGIHQIRVIADHMDGGTLSIAVPFIYGKTETRILSPASGEWVENGAALRGVVNPGVSYPGVFRVYRAYQTKGAVVPGSGLSWLKLMGLADWQPMLVPLSQQLTNTDSIELHSLSDKRYPHANLGARSDLAGGVLAFFQANQDSVHTLLLVSEWKNAEGAVERDYDWVTVRSAVRNEDSDSLKLLLSRDTLNLSDSLSENDTVHVTIKTSAPAGSVVEWVLSQNSKVASGRLLVGTGGSGLIRLTGKDAFGLQLSSGEYNLYVQISGSPSGVLQQRRSVWMIAPDLAAQSGVMKVFPDPLLWNPAIRELSQVQIDVNLPVPTLYRLEIHRETAGWTKTLTEGRLARSGSHYYDLTDSDDNLLNELWARDSVSFTAKLFAADSLIVERKFTVIAADLLQSTKPLLTTSSLTADSVQSGFRFQALAKGPISYYPLRLVDYSSHVTGEQVLKHYKDVPYRLKFRKFYNSVELLSSSYYRVRKVDFINLGFWNAAKENRERNTEPLVQRYSFFNMENAGGQNRRRWSDDVRTTPESAQADLWYGDFPALKNEFTYKIGGDLPKAVLDPAGNKINVQSFELTSDTLFSVGGISSLFGYSWVNIASFYNVQNPWLGSLQPSAKPSGLSDRPIQAFAASSIIKLKDNFGDDEWRRQILDGYVNVFFMRRQNCDDINNDLENYASLSPLSNDYRLSTQDSKYYGELIYAVTTTENDANSPIYPVGDDITAELFKSGQGWAMPGEKLFMTNKESTTGMYSHTEWDFTWDDFGEDKYEARVYTYRPEINWEHSYLQNDGAVNGKNLNFRRQGGLRPTYEDPSPWSGENTCDVKDLVTKIVKRKYNDKVQDDTLRYCISSHGGPKHGIRGFVYKMDTTFVNRFQATLRPEQVIRNFYDRNLNDGHVRWTHPAFDVKYVDAEGNVINSSQAAAGAKLVCIDAKADITDDLFFSPRLETDSLYALGVVWDTATVAFPLLSGADTLYELNPQTNQIFAFGDVKGLSRYPFRNVFDTLKSSRYARESGVGNYVDTAIYDLTVGYDSLKKVLDSVVMVPSNPLAIYNYIRSNRLNFRYALKSQELDARGRVVDSTAFEADNAYLHAETDTSGGRHLLKVYYKAIPRSMGNWNASLDSSLAATNGWLYGRGSVNRQVFLAQDSGLIGGFLGLVGTKGLSLPQASPYSMAPFVMDSGKVLYNKNINVDSLQWDLQIYQMDGVTPSQAVSVVSADSRNMRLELQSQATLQAVLPVRGVIDSVLVQNGDTYRFANYRLQWRVADQDGRTVNDTAKNHAIVVNRFFVRPGGDIYTGDIVPQVNLDFWAAEEDTVPILGYWNTTGLNGFYRVSLAVTYFRESDGSFATLYEDVPVALGHRLKPGSDVLELTSQEKRASLSMPAQYLDSNTLVSLHTLAPSEIGELPGLPDVLPVGPVLRVSSTGMRLFDADHLPSVTYRISARELFAMAGLSDFDDADTGAVYTRMRQDSGAYQVHVLGDNGQLEALPTMVALNYALESGSPARFDRDAAALILSAAVPHFSYILLLPAGTELPDYAASDSVALDGPWVVSNWVDGPDPLVPVCGDVAHSTRFVSDRQGVLSRVLLDQTGNMLRHDSFVIGLGNNLLNWDGCADGSALKNGIYHFEYQFTGGPVILRSVGIGQVAGSVHSVTVDRDPFVPGVNGDGPGLGITTRVQNVAASRIHFAVTDSLGDTLWVSAPQSSQKDVDGSLIHKAVWNGLGKDGVTAKSGKASVAVFVDAAEAPSAVRWFKIGTNTGTAPMLEQTGVLSVPVSHIALRVRSEETVNVQWLIVNNKGDTLPPLIPGPPSLSKGLSQVNLSSASEAPVSVGMQWSAPLSGMGGIVWLNLQVNDLIPVISEMNAMGGDTLDPEIPAEWVVRMGGVYSNSSGYTWNSEAHGFIRWAVHHMNGNVMAENRINVAPGYGSFAWAPFDAGGKAYEEGSYRMAVYAVSPAGRDSLLAERDLYVRRIPDVVVVLPDQASPAQLSRASLLRELLIARDVRRVKILDGAGVSAYLGYALETAHQGLVAFIDSVPPHTLFSGEARNPIYLALRNRFNFAFLGAQPLRWKHGTHGAPVFTPGAALPLFRMADSYLLPEELVRMDTTLFTGSARSLQYLDTALADGFSYALSPLSGALHGEAVRIGKYRGFKRKTRNLDTAANAAGESGVLAHSAFYRPDFLDGAFLVFSPYGIVRSNLLIQDYAWMIDRFFFTPDIGVVEERSHWASNRKDSTEVARGSKVSFHVRVRAIGRQTLDSRLVVKAPTNNNWQDSVVIESVSPYEDGADYVLTMPIAADAPFDTMDVILSLAPVKARDPMDSTLIRHETDLTNNEWHVKLVVEDTVAPRLISAPAHRAVLPGFLSTGAEGFPYLLHGPVYTNHGFGSVQARLRLLSSGSTQMDFQDSCLAESDSILFTLNPLKALSGKDTATVRLDLRDKYGNDTSYYWTLRLDDKRPLIKDLKIANALAVDSLDGQLRYLGGAGDAVFQAEITDERALRAWFLTRETDTLAADSGSTWAQKLNFKLNHTVSEGLYFLQVRDSAGNLGRAQVLYGKDSVAPVLNVYRVLAPALPPDTANPELLNVWRLYPNRRTDDGIQHLADSAFFVGGAQPGNWRATLDVRNMTTVGLVVWVTESNSAASPSVVLVGEGGLDTLVLPHSAYVNVDPSHTSEVRFRNCDLVGNCSEASIVLENPAPDLAFTDAAGDGISATGMDFGELHVHRHDSLGISRLSFALHSYTAATVDQDMNLHVYMDLDDDQTTGAQVTLADGKNIAGADVRLEVRKLSGDDRDAQNVLAVSRYTDGEWSTLSTVEGRAQDLQSGLALGANQLDALWSQTVGEGYQVLPGGRIATAPGGVLEMQWNTSGAADTIRVFVDDGNDAVYDTARVEGLPVVAKSFKALSADGWISDWWTSKPVVATYSRYTAETKVQALRDSEIVIHVAVRNEGFTTRNHLKIQVPIDVPVSCSDFSIRPASPPGSPVWTSPALLSRERSGVLLQLESSALTAGSSWEVPAVVVNGCGLNAEAWTSRVGAAIAEDDVP